MFAAGLRKIFLPRRSHIALCRTGDADGGFFRRACERTVEQAFASYEFQHRERQSDAAAGFHFSDQGTRAVRCLISGPPALRKGKVTILLPFKNR
jgi:hypothetical protein